MKKINEAFLDDLIMNFKWIKNAFHCQLKCPYFRNSCIRWLTALDSASFYLINMLYVINILVWKLTVMPSSVTAELKTWSQVATECSRKMRSYIQKKGLLEKHNFNAKRHNYMFVWARRGSLLNYINEPFNCHPSKPHALCFYQRLIGLV